MIDSFSWSEQTIGVSHANRVAIPWILGLYGLASATFILATRWADWYRGNGTESTFLLLPFALTLGGIMLLAAFWAFLAADGLATAMLGIWGSFWIGYVVLNALFIAGKLFAPIGSFPELGFSFITLAAITWVGAVAAVAENTALVGTLAFLAAGSTIAAIGTITGHSGLMMLTGWLFFIGSVLGWYTATGMLFETVFQRSVLPLHLQTTVAWPPSRATGSGGDVSGLGQAPSRRSG